MQGLDNLSHLFSSCKFSVLFSHLAVFHIYHFLFTHIAFIFCTNPSYLHPKDEKLPNNKKEKNLSKPLHFVSSDGFDIFVGKNNIQNEELTFKVATGNDWWFHSKTFPGSHVIVKANNSELPDKTFEEAARLAAHFSKGQAQDKVEIDYIQKKHIKKVAGAMPGFVIYHTNYSMNISPDITGIKEI